MKLNTNQRYGLLAHLHKYHENFDKDPHNVEPIAEYIETIFDIEIRKRVNNYKIPDTIFSSLKEDLKTKIK